MSGLRERRRAETLREISDAALDLFEEQGSTATTVDQIAERAGISPRTFFRYFPRKEDAAFWTEERWSHERALQVVENAARSIRAGAEPIAALEAELAHVFADFDADEDARTRFLRHRQLVRVDGNLLAAALQRDSVMADLMTEQLRGALQADADSPLPRAAVEFALSAFRVTFDEWARVGALGQETDLRSTHEQVLTILGAAAAANQPPRHHRR